MDGCDIFSLSPLLLTASFYDIMASRQIGRSAACESTAGLPRLCSLSGEEAPAETKTLLTRKEERV